MEGINELIVVKQLPVIEEHLKTIGEEAKKKIDMALSMPCTTDTKKAVKDMRASLNKDYKALEEARKKVENEISEQLRPFRDTYKEYITSVFTDADSKLKSKIAEVEDTEKLEKENSLREYFKELSVASECEFLPFEIVIPKVDLSKSETFYKKQIDSKIEQVNKDISVIDKHEHSSELMVEYVKTFDLAESLVTVTNRHMQMASFSEAQTRREEKTDIETEVVDKVEEALAPPTVVEDDDKVYTMTFTVSGTKPRLKELKHYLIKEGYINE